MNPIFNKLIQTHFLVDEEKNMDQIPANSILVLEGAQGSGKTTAAKQLAGEGGAYIDLSLPPDDVGHHFETYLILDNVEPKDQAKVEHFVDQFKEHSSCHEPEESDDCGIIIICRDAQKDLGASLLSKVDFFMKRTSNEDSESIWDLVATNNNKSNTFTIPIYPEDDAAWLLSKVKEQAHILAHIKHLAT